MPRSAAHVHPSSTPTRGAYAVDPECTVVRFHTRHLFGLGAVNGTVGVRSGEIIVGSSESDTTVRAVLDAASVTTGNPFRDRAVRSARYLNTAEHPDIEFNADAVGVVDGTQAANGRLTAHGVTTSLQVRALDVTEDLAQLTIHAEATVDRYAHGITSSKGLAGRYLRVDILAVARRR